MQVENKIKLLFLHHGIGIGGAPLSLLKLVNALDGSKFKTKVLFLQDGKAVKLFRDHGIDTKVLHTGVPYFSLAHTGKIQWYYVLFHIRVFWMWIKTAYIIGPEVLANEDFDILHLNSHALSAWSVAGSKMKKNVIIHNREAISDGYFGLRKRWLQKVIGKYCVHTINICRDNMLRLDLEQNSSVVYNFINIPETYRIPLEAEEVKVLFLGGTSKIKGYETVLDALEYFDANIKVIFAGNISGQSSSTFKKVLRKLFFIRHARRHKTMMGADNIEILGLLENPLEAIDNCDILISPFLFGHFSRPAIEAFAYGKPVIVSDANGGLDEIVENGINGYTFQKGNPVALADAVNMLARQRDLGIRMGENGRNKAKRLFSPDVNIAIVSEIYRDIYFNAN